MGSRRWSRQFSLWHPLDATDKTSSDLQEDREPEGGSASPWDIRSSKAPSVISGLRSRTRSASQSRWSCEPIRSCGLAGPAGPQPVKNLSRAKWRNRPQADLAAIELDPAPGPTLGCDISRPRPSRL